MIKICENNHIQICFDAKERQEEIKCPVCKEMNKTKEYGKENIKLIEKKTRSNEKVVELNVEIGGLEKMLDEVKSILANYSSD